MRKELYLAVLGVAGLVLASCVVTSANPLVGLGASAPISEGWFGTWTVEQIADQPPAVALTVEIEANSDGSVEVTLRDGQRASQLSASLAVVGGSTIASVVAPNGSWSILRLVPDAAQTQLTLEALDQEVVKTDVRNGVISGEVSSFSVDEEIVRLTATSDALRAYVASHLAAFNGNVVAVLRKVPAT
jgi:hypothetical protein